MKARSPLLGYNHNIRYGDQLYHVQTEDSGPSNPHVSTHLFVGGTILATERTDYDPALPDGEVRRRMQGQHKAMLKGLRGGRFDEAIGRTFGVSALPVKRGAPAPVPSLPKPPPAPPQPPRVCPQSPDRVERDSQSGSRGATRAPTGGRQPRSDKASRGENEPDDGRTLRTDTRGRSGPVVHRPVVIVGAEPGKKSSVFGAESSSEKSLDEVILAYLAEEPKRPS